MSERGAGVSCYSKKLDEAFALAMDAFRDKVRKGSRVPYLTHLMQVWVTVAEHGGDEDQQIAAVLHDYLEDIPGASMDDLRVRFGPRAAGFVLSLSDTTEHPKPPWRPRKEQYIAVLRAESADLKLVSAADKLHNAQCLVRDLETLGEALWARFSAPKAEQLWYYREVLAALRAGWAHPLTRELESQVRRLHVLSNEEME